MNQPTATQPLQARNLGIPVRSVNWVRLLPGRKRDGSPSLLATMGQDAGGIFILDIDLDTGRCTQHETAIPDAHFSTAVYRDPNTGVVYVGSAYAGHLHRYDPDVGRLEDLGPINPDTASFPCRIDQSPDGRIWIGSYGGCSLDVFDPASETFRHVGRMDDTDMYFYPLAGLDGTIAGLVRMCRQHVVVIDPDTGEHHAVGPVIDTDKQEGKIELIKAADGLLYITSTKGDFAVRGMTAAPIDKAPDPMPAPTLPDGSVAAMADSDTFMHRTVRITSPAGDTRDLSLDWTSGGTHIFMMHHGPDGRVYGSSMLPEHLFSYDPAAAGEGDDMTDHGQCSVSGGEAYSMADHDGLLYIASYPAARLSIYDPARPYNFGEDERANPRDIGRLDDVAYRPRAMLAGPAGKVWIASVPDYGMWGGTLAWYDPAADTHKSHRHIVPDTSPVTLDYLPQLDALLVGTIIEGGSGTKPRAENAAFVLWDPHEDRAIDVTDFGIEHLASIYSSAVDVQGRVYAVIAIWKDTARHVHDRGVTTHLALLDPAARQAVDHQPLPDDVKAFTNAFVRGEGDDLWLATNRGLMPIEPGSATLGVAVPVDPPIGVAGPVVAGRLHYAFAHEVFSVELPGFSDLK